jgi:hypothetical protein
MNKDVSTYIKLWLILFDFTDIYNPEFDTKNRKKVPEALNLLACGTFPDFAAARYSLCLLVSAQIFFIFLIGTISLDVQKPNAS